MALTGDIDRSRPQQHGAQRMRAVTRYQRIYVVAGQRLVRWCVSQYWHDYQLQWEPTQYGNINFSLRIDPDRVWKPDIVLFNKYA